MPKYLAKAETCVSHLSVTMKAGETLSFELPQVKHYEFDADGKAIMERGHHKFVVAPMRLSDNLVEVTDEEVAAAKPSKKKETMSLPDVA